MKRILLAVLLMTALLSPMASAPAAPVPGTDDTYTTDNDFDRGVLTDVNHDAPNDDQLQLDEVDTFFPYVNIAASARGTAIRIDVETGATVGEWWTAPAGRSRNPSRTTVDTLGNVWVANRDESTGGKGSVARIGVVTGGTRANADGSSNPSGDYLKPPFAYSTCVDRDGDTLIKTSRGLGDIRPWTNAGGADDNGGVSTAGDECIINYTRVTGTNTRTVAVDPDTNDVWVGGTGDLDHERLDGASGSPVAGSQFNLGCGGYGGLIDGTGVLWSARSGSGLLRYDTSASAGECLGFSRGDYGLALDPGTGEIWHTFLGGNRVAKLAPDGTLLGIFPHGEANAQGVAVDKFGNVWVAHALFGSTTVGHLRTDGTFVGNVALPGGNGPTGVAIDANDKVWVANVNSNNAMRIDPTAGAVGGGGFPVGAVDLTVDLGLGAGPYNYSDMTGAVLGTVTAPVGSWSVVQDSGYAGSPWGTVTWNTEPEGTTPPDTSITAEARASDTEEDLAVQAFVPIDNGVPFSIAGRFIEVRMTLTANGDGDSPVLSDVRIEVANRPPNCTAAAVDVSRLWPPNHKMHDVTVSGVTDPDPGDTVAVVVSGVTQDEPVNGLGDGDTSPDAQLASPPSNAVSVRAERRGGGDGRIYRLEFIATDSFGASCNAVVTVGVPHDQGKNSVPVDSAPPSFNSLTP